MQYISSDTNIWIDFSAINALEMPFRLDNIYCMSRDALEDEWLNPTHRDSELLQLGLQVVEISTEEFYYALEARERYPAISAYDAFALAIAKIRHFILLTGDKALRNAANKESVEVRGTLWIFDELIENGKISVNELLDCLEQLREINGTVMNIGGLYENDPIQQTGS